MPINLTGLSETDYFLPDDGVLAKSDFLKVLRIPAETWLYVFAFNMPDLYAEILDIDVAGIPVHMLVDHTQSTTPGEHLGLLKFAANLKVSDVTITTAGIGSNTTGAISHSKAIVSRALDGGEMYCFEGSVNMSDTAWSQAQTFRMFRSDLWGSTLVAHFNEHKQWALAKHPEWQIAVGGRG
jgi:hypothetical protein